MDFSTVELSPDDQEFRDRLRAFLVDVVTDVNVGNDTAWHQVTTFLHQQRTSLSDEPKRRRVSAQRRSAGEA